MSADVTQLSSAMIGMRARLSNLPQAVEIVRRDRLFQHRDAELLEHRQHADRVRRRPAAVGVHPDLPVGGVAHRPQNGEIVARCRA